MYMVIKQIGYNNLSEYLFSEFLFSINGMMRTSFGCRLRDTSIGTNGGETLGVLGRAGLDYGGEGASKE